MEPPSLSLPVRSTGEQSDGVLVDWTIVTLAFSLLT